MVFPEIPPFGALRLAHHCDITRIAEVATAGFHYSEVFQFERAYHEQYPQDTVASYQEQFATSIRDPRCVVLVAEETCNSKSNGYLSDQDPNAGRAKIIVGVASWRLEPGSPRVGQFQDSAETGVIAAGSKAFGRDRNSERVRRVAEARTRAVQQHFSNHSMLDRLVVHPDYWCRGHGTALVKWGLRLAKMDQVCQGVFSTIMGSKLVLSLGFQKLTDILIEGDSDAPTGLSLAVKRYDPLRVDHLP